MCDSLVSDEKEWVTSWSGPCVEDGMEWSGSFASPGSSHPGISRLSFEGKGGGAATCWYLELAWVAHVV